MVGDSWLGTMTDKIDWMILPKALRDLADCIEYCERWKGDVAQEYVVLRQKAQEERNLRANNLRGYLDKYLPDDRLP